MWLTFMHVSSLVDFNQANHKHKVKHVYKSFQNQGLPRLSRFTSVVNLASFLSSSLKNTKVVLLADCFLLSGNRAV